VASNQSAILNGSRPVSAVVIGDDVELFFPQRGTGRKARLNPRLLTTTVTPRRLPLGVVERSYR
jgi:hypothetical protein